MILAWYAQYELLLLIAAILDYMTTDTRR